MPRAGSFPRAGCWSAKSPKIAMFRELHEEVGLEADDVELLGVTSRLAALPSPG